MEQPAQSTDATGDPSAHTETHAAQQLTTRSIGALLDACQKAKRITEALLPLPVNVRSAHVHVIDTIHLLHERGIDQVRVSDISESRHVTRPNVTKLVNELESMGLVTKQRSATDGRVVTVDLTDRGRELRRIYVGDYHLRITERIAPVSDADVQATIRTIDALYDAIISLKTRDDGHHATSAERSTEQSAERR